jgi:hypothetical protein
MLVAATPELRATLVPNKLHSKKNRAQKDSHAKKPHCIARVRPLKMRQQARGNEGEMLSAGLAVVGFVVEVVFVGVV